jgi:hypothetical protein
MAFWLILVAIASILITAALTWLLWRINAAQMSGDAGSDSDSDTPSQD